MVIISLTFSPREDVREAVLAAWTAMIKDSQTEPGCITFGVSTDLLAPNALRLYEEWEDLQALKAHRQMPHTRRFQAAMAELGENAMNVHAVARYIATPLDPDELG